MYLGLMRHGEAQPFVLGQADDTRALTEKGRRQVASVAALARRLWPLGQTDIWTSPVIRAKETAAVMSRSIRAASLSIHDAVGEGDFQALYQEGLMQAKADAVLIIGHEPYLSRWFHSLTGMSQDFKPGTLAILDYDPSVEPVGQASLLVYVQPQGADLILRRL